MKKVNKKEIMLINIKCLVLLLSLCMVNQNALGEIYKCKKGGKVKYQPQPCMNSQGEESKLKLDKQKQSDKRKISVKFEDMSVLSVLQVIADASGSQLVYDSSIARMKRSERLHYRETPWDVLLNIIAKRNSLDIKVKNKTIYARKHSGNDNKQVVYHEWRGRDGKTLPERLSSGD